MGSIRRRGPAPSRLLRARLLTTLTGMLATALLAAPACARHGPGADSRTVEAIAAGRMPIDTAQGHGEFALDISADWSVPQPEIVRAVIVLHGRLRNADDYYRTAQRARALAEAAGVDPAGTLLIAPQFLSTADTRTHAAPPDLLSWEGNAWMGGADAATGAPVSAYAVLDAIARRLADKQRFPNLKTIVFAGHSGGAQVLQRYAIASETPESLAQAGIAVRFVVASPSTYAYFDALRPGADGAPARFDAARCPGFDTWKYGMEARPGFMLGHTPAQLEARYAQRRIVYLVGGADDNPASVSLDKSCAGEAQGPQRLARAQGFFRYMQTRHSAELNQEFHIVPGVGHDGARMLTSPCAVKTMFDVGSCSG
ncbi:alpha/beta hydrolase [Paraburkholderia pallida]|uniref:alpha/beta hydrolase n=1 Tax=Paraburkholderia pallida TaxID=2547399 RepID=UPI001E421AAF|nr:alpha/beta hydrolase [Paraburkholderia pallida]